MLAHSHWPALALTFDEAAGTLQQRPGLANRAAIFIVHRSRSGEQLLSAFRRFGTFTQRSRCGRVPEAELTVVGTVTCTEVGPAPRSTDGH